MGRSFVITRHDGMDGFPFQLSCFLKFVFHNDTLKRFQVAVGWKTVACCFTTHTIRLYCLKQSRHYFVIYTKCQITAKSVIRKKQNKKNIYLRWLDTELHTFRTSGSPIELLHIECVLLYPVSQKCVSTKWRIYKGKINSPQDFLL